MERTYKPDTIKSYLISLRYFCSFILTERPDGVNVEDATINFIDKKARLWSSSYKKDSQRRHLEKQDEDLSNLTSAEMITKLSRVNQHEEQINQADYTN